MDTQTITTERTPRTSGYGAGTSSTSSSGTPSFHARYGTESRRALILDSDPRSALYVRDVLARINVHAEVARSLLEVGPHLTVPPPALLISTLPAKDAVAHIEFAAALRMHRGTSCVFVVDRLDSITANALAESGERTVLCKPVHREQLEATFLLALRQSGRPQAQAVADPEAVQQRERHLENALRRVAEAVAIAGVGPVDSAFGAVSLPGLRPREEEIVRLLLQHVRVPAIAGRLGIKQQTVRNHLKGAFKRTGVRSQQELLDHFTRTSAGA
ncbi:MAG: LuxR C-terminal-related transcriptional regulator [Vicinamibacterales bacterium]